MAELLTARVDKLFADWNKPDSPGCAIAIIQEGEIIYMRGYGMADLEHDIPISSKSIFDIGSTSKQFTAICIALLICQEKLSLDDEVQKYITEMAIYEHPITIRHLVHHISGIRDYLSLMELAGMRFENEYPDEEVIGLISQQKGLNFITGEEYLYSNSGYILLAEVVKRVSGQSLSKFADEQLFKPLGMDNTHFHDDFTMIVKERAMGYSPNDQGGYRIDMSIFDVVGDGCIYTNVEDLYLWDKNFYLNILGGYGQDLIEMVTTTGTLNSGEPLDYAFGLEIGEYKGLKMVHHSGSWMGYGAELIRFPEQRSSVICLTNLSSINPSRLTKQVADLYFSD
jgi:CubicO group peptidase (beta-lactamase class C family)